LEIPPKTNTANRISYKERREFEQLEKELGSLGKLKEELTNKLNEANLPFESLQATAVELETIINDLDQKELRWLELSEKL